MARTGAKNGTVYTRIWRSMACMVSAVFLLAGTAITLYVNRTTTAQIEEHERAYLAGVDTILTQQISSAQQVLGMLLTNPFIVRAIHTGNDLFSSEVYWSGQIMVNAIGSNQVYNSIYAISGDHVAIKSSRRYQTAEDEAALIRCMREDYQRLLIPWRSQVGESVNNNLMLLSSLDALGTLNETGGVLINLDLNRLAELAFANRGGREVCLVLDGQIVASTDASRFFTAVSAHPVLGEAARDGRYGDSNVFSLRNPVYGYTIYSVQDHVAMVTPVARGVLALMAAISALLVVALLVARRAALHAYVPVKTILIELESLPAAPGSAAEPGEGPAPRDGEGLSEVQRFTRSIRRTRELVSAYRRDADTARLSRYILGGANDLLADDILQRLLGAQADQPVCLLLFAAGSAEDAHMAADVLQGLLSESARFLTLDMPGGRLLSLACLAEEQQDAGAVEQAAGKVLALLRAQGAGKAVVTLQTARGLSELPEAYTRAEERMRSGVFCPDGALLAAPRADGVARETAERFAQAMLSPDEAAYAAAEADYLAACSEIPAQEAYHQLASLCMRVEETASGHGGDAAGRLNAYRATLDALFALPDSAALLAYLRGLRQSALERMDARRSGESNPLIDRILAYMSGHFADPVLSAAQVAQALGISQSYMSRVINKALGCGFPETLQRMRLKHAVALLTEQPDVSIADLAQQCGFSSASYFTASFKKVYGVTPSGYRQQRADAPGGSRKDA